MHKETVAVSRVGDLGLEIWEDNNPPQPEEQYGIGLYIDPGVELIPHKSWYKSGKELFKGLLERDMDFDLVSGQSTIMRDFAAFCFANRNYESTTEWVVEQLLNDGMLSEELLAAAGAYFASQDEDFFIDYLTEVNEAEDLLGYIEALCGNTSIWPVYLVEYENFEKEVDFFLTSTNACSSGKRRFGYIAGYIFGCLKKTPENLALIEGEIARYTNHYRRRKNGNFFGATFYKICPCCQHWSPASERQSSEAYGDPSYHYDRERIYEALFPARHREKREAELELIEALKWSEEV